jgi:hypothetical protein
VKIQECISAWEDGGAYILVAEGGGRVGETELS